MFRVVLLVGALMAAQNSPTVGLLEQDGWAAIKAGNHQAALTAFREAIKLDPKNAWLRLGAGTAEFLARRDAESKAHLEQALVLDPTLTRARAQLAQVYKRQGDLGEAIRLYQAVAADVPNDEGVRDTLDRWARERDLHDRMRLEVGDFFTVSFEGEEDAALDRPGHRIAESGLLADWRRVWRLPDEVRSGRALHRRAVSGCDAIAKVGGRGLRRDHSRADAGGR
ncbi:MAG: tetratricopeptide repeat protein [Acidimicrobiia bacterium]